MNEKLNKKQIQNLMSKLEQSTGINQNDLRSAEKGQLGSVMNKLNPGQAEQLKKVLADKQSAEKLFSSPEARELLKKFMDGGK